MSLIDWQAIEAAGGIGKGPSRLAEKQQKRLDREKQWRDVCHFVDARDGRQCRVCGKYCDPNSSLEDRAERHHIVAKSAGGKSESSNLVTLCHFCHQGEGGRHGLTAAMRISGDANLRDAVTGRLCGVKVERLEGDTWAVWKWV